MKKIAMMAVLGTCSLALAACDVEQTEEGDMPEISVEEGNMPEYDVDTADVEIGTETETVEVPTIDVEEADASEE